MVTLSIFLKKENTLLFTASNLDTSFSSMLNALTTRMPVKVSSRMEVISAVFSCIWRVTFLKRFPSTLMGMATKGKVIKLMAANFPPQIKAMGILKRIMKGCLTKSTITSVTAPWIYATSLMIREIMSPVRPWA